MDYASLWADTDEPDGGEERTPLETTLLLYSAPPEGAVPAATEQSRLFDLLGKINYKILQGSDVYLQVSGAAYRVLYGVYWRSVYTGAQFWGLRCAEIADGMWREESAARARIDLPLRYTKNGWMIETQSLRFLLYDDSFTRAASLPPTMFQRMRFLPRI